MLSDAFGHLHQWLPLPLLPLAALEVAASVIFSSAAAAANTTGMSCAVGGSPASTHAAFSIASLSGRKGYLHADTAALFNGDARVWRSAEAQRSSRRGVADWIRGLLVDRRLACLMQQMLGQEAIEPGVQGGEARTCRRRWWHPGGG